MSTAMSALQHSRALALLVCCGLCSGPGFAQPQQHPLISPFPDSELVDVEFVEAANYRLVLGTLQRTRGVVVPQDSRRLRGDITKLRYQVAQQFSGEDVFDFFRQQFTDRGYTMLFTCSGRECGSSNYWANDIFRNRVLYGPQLNQHYLVVQAGDAHIVLYIITRGNRRLFAYLEIIEPQGSVPAIAVGTPVWLDAIVTTGSMAISGLRFRNDRQLADTGMLPELAAELIAAPELEFYVVAHLSGEQALEQLLERSTVRAQTVRRQLVDLGVAAGRLTARGLGPLAPACAGTDCRDRVELVLHRGSFADQ